MLDLVKLSSNDHVGNVGFMVVDLMADMPQRDEYTELYSEEADGGNGVEEFKVHLLSSNGKGIVAGET